MIFLQVNFKKNATYTGYFTSEKTKHSKLCIFVNFDINVIRLVATSTSSRSSISGLSTKSLTSALNDMISVASSANSRHFKNDKQRKRQNDKYELSNVKFTNPEEAANLYGHRKSQPIMM
jgi:uncharacterized protein YhbP (UPF0306 family)